MRARWTMLFRIYAFWIGFFFIARLIFITYHHLKAGQVPISELALSFRYGLRLDAAAAAYLTIPALIILLASSFESIRAVSSKILFGWVAVAITFCSFLVVIDLEYARQWEHRVDPSLLTYLATPSEALASSGGHPRLFLTCLSISLALLSFWTVRRALRAPISRWAIAPGIERLGILAALVPLLVAARGGIQAIPLTEGSAYFSERHFANLAAQNPVWGFGGMVVKGMRAPINPYRSMDVVRAREIVAAAKRPVGASSAIPLGVKRPNILLIIWESGSARAFGSLGGVPDVTPAFDALTDDGILFRRFFASGDRTDKGIAAILSGFPGLPRGSILTLPDKTAQLPKLASDLRDAGYHTSFYYGGELGFAALRGYVVQSAFQQVIDKADFSKKSWNSKWGAHDGVVADRLLADLDRMRTPFFSTWLTLSSHEPFEIPTGKMPPLANWQTEYFHSMRYTDGVLGELIAKMKKKSWWKETLVVIVADHGRRVMPLDSTAQFQDPEAFYRIPMLWLGGALTARDSVVDQIGSQLDLAPTLTAIAGTQPKVPYAWGRSLFEATTTPFAYYAFEEGFGVVTNHGSVVYDYRAKRATTRRGRNDESELLLGHALMELTYQQLLLDQLAAKP